MILREIQRMSKSARLIATEKDSELDFSLSPVAAIQLIATATQKKYLLKDTSTIPFA